MTNRRLHKALSATGGEGRGMPSLTLTPTVVRDARCPNDKRKLDLFDTHTRKLMLEVRSSGRKTYYLRYQDARAKTR